MHLLFATIVRSCIHVVCTSRLPTAYNSDMCPFSPTTSATGFRTHLFARAFEGAGTWFASYRQRQRYEVPLGNTRKNASSSLVSSLFGAPRAPEVLPLSSKPSTAAPEHERERPCAKKCEEIPARPFRQHVKKAIPFY